MPKHMNQRAFAAIVAPILLLASTITVSFCARCAGDTKAASYGDPLLALRLEVLAFVLFLLFVASIAWCLVSAASLPLSQRVAFLAIFFGVGVPVLWLLLGTVTLWSTYCAAAPLPRLEAHELAPSTAGAEAK